MKITIKVEGMKCMHCVSAVKGALGEINGVKEVEVVLEDGIVNVDFDESVARSDALTEAIEDQGFEASVD